MRTALRLLPLVVALSASPIACSEELSQPTASFELLTSDVAVGATVSLDASLSRDPNGLPLSFRWRLQAVPEGSVAAIASPDAALTWFAPDVSGEYRIELTVSDGAFSSEPVTATLTAGPCGGHAPLLGNVQWSPQAPTSGQIVVLASDAFDADSDPACGAGEVLSYAWSLTGAPAGSRAALTSALEHPSFVVDEPGPYRVRLIVTDRAGHSAPPLDRVIEVTGCGVPRGRVDAITAPAGASVGDTVTLGATLSTVAAPPIPDAGTALPEAGSDDAGADSSSDASTTDGAPDGAAPDGAAPDAAASDAGTDAPTTPDGGSPSCTATLTRHWTIVSVPPGSRVSLVNSPLEAPSFVPDLAGDYVVELYVDNAWGERSDAVRITVHVDACGSNAPVLGAIVATPASVGVGLPITLATTVTDADVTTCAAVDPATLTWSLLAVPAGSRSELSDAHQASPWLTPDVPGTYRVGVLATDLAGHTSPIKTFDLVASSCGNASPVVSALAQAPASALVGDVVRVTATVSDADTTGSCARAQTFAYAWSLTSVPVGSAALLDDPAAQLVRFTPDVAGAYALSLIVRDDQGHASAAKTLTVSAGAASTCGTAAPVALLAGFAQGACAVATCPTNASITPVPPAGPATTAPNYTVRLNGHVSVQLDASASRDADNLAPCSAKQTLTYLWTLSSAPVGSAARWNIGDGATTTMTAPTLVTDVAGVYLATLVVSDGARSSALLTVRVER